MSSFQKSSKYFFFTLQYTGLQLNKTFYTNLAILFLFFCLYLLCKLNFKLSPLSNFLKQTITLQK